MSGVLNGSSCQHIGKRANQEDAMKVSSEKVRGTHGILAVLSDGMGGMEAGEVFSAITTMEMVKAFEENPPIPDMCSQILACYQAAQKKALAAQPEDENRRGGATVVAVLIRKNQCVFLTSGDSRLYLIRSGGLIQLSRDQSLGIKLDERAALGFIDREQAKQSIGRRALVGHVGTLSGVLPDMCAHPFQMASGDRLVLASDGVFGTLDDDTMVRLAMGPVNQAAEEMIRQVIDRDKPGQDNCSVMIIEYTEAA